MTWHEALDSACDGRLTKQHTVNVMANALLWDFCPTKDVTGIERHLNGMPRDKGLAELGNRFSKEVRSQCWYQARNTLHEIENWK